MSDFEQCSNRLQLDLVWILVNFSCELGANNDQMRLPIGWMSDSEQCPNRLQLDLILILVNFSC